MLAVNHIMIIISNYLHNAQYYLLISIRKMIIGISKVQKLTQTVHLQCHSKIS